jgi:hypothetical protein
MLRYNKRKQYNKLGDEEILKCLDQRKETKLPWLREAVKIVEIIWIN